MEYSKLYQYKDVTKVSSFDYSGNLAIKTKEDNQYDVSSPINTIENYSINEDVIIINNTLNNEESMKFNFNFKVNKDVIGTGTRNILDFPGLLSVKSENNTLWFKFYYEDAPVWKYINASELVDGWNNVALVGDGVKVTLTVNSTVHTLVGGTPKYTVVNFPVKTESDQAILDQILASGKWEVSNGVLKNVKVDDRSGAAYAHFTLHTTKICLFSVNASISSEQNYDFGAVYVGSDIYEPTQDQLKKKTTDGKGNYLVIGSGTTLEGGPNTSVNADGDISMQLAENTDYVISFAYAKDGSGSSGDDCLSIYKYGTSAYEPKYPTLSLGTLKTYQSWIYLKDIEAVKIVDASGGNTGGEEPPVQNEPPVKASDLPQGWAMWQISGGVFRYSKGLPGKDSDGYYDSYVLYTNINVDDLSQYQTEDSVVLGESEGLTSKYIIQAKGTPITLIASKIQTSDDKKGK